jgi:hypothetical protein
MPSYIIPGEKVQFFEPPRDETHDGGESHGEHDEHEEQLQEYVDPIDSQGNPSGHVRFDDVVQEHPVSHEPRPELIGKKKNNDWIFFIILLLIAVGASIFFKG